MSALRVAVVGAAGKMGRLVVAAILDHPEMTLAAALGRKGSASEGLDVGVLAGRGPAGIVITGLTGGSLGGVDVVIDFSGPEGLAELLPILGEAALVSGTTGLGDALQAALSARAAVAPVLHAANFSTGVTLLLHLVGVAARALPDADIEIVEAHHKAKRDAPSGTALALGKAAAEARGQALGDVARLARPPEAPPRVPQEIGFHAVRGGDVIGHHEVWLLPGGERLILQHEAHHRGVFAQGAVQAAAWLARKGPGLYGMADVLGLVTAR